MYSIERAIEYFRRELRQPVCHNHDEEHECEICNPGKYHRGDV